MCHGGEATLSDETHTTGGRKYEFKVEKMMSLMGLEHLHLSMVVNVTLSPLPLIPDQHVNTVTIEGYASSLPEDIGEVDNRGMW